MQSRSTWHALSKKAVFAQQKSSLEGLSTLEAHGRLEQTGRNVLPRDKKASALLLFLRQFLSPLMIILVAAGLVSIALGEWVDAWVIIAAVVLNTIIGFIQEWKAHRSLESLHNLVQPHVRVRRGGLEMEVVSEELVPGDIVLLTRGDQIVADARLIEVHGLLVNESSLTGESVSIEKQTKVCAKTAAIGDRLNMVHAGTAVVAGNGLAIVVETGIRTELGQIAQLVKRTQDDSTPLQDQLRVLATWISVVVALLVSLLFLFGVTKGIELFEMFELAVALAVAAIPEGLLVAITISLAIGTQRLLKHKSLTRRLVAAETLGSVSVICSDKTGTLTEGVMKANVFLPENARKQLLELVVLCNDAVLDGEHIDGSPTEVALMRAGIDEGLDVLALRAQHKRLGAIAFDSSRKYMATLHKDQLIVKGAPERVLAFCGGCAPWKKQVTKMTNQGLRVIAVGQKQVFQKTLKESDLSGMTIVGLIGMRDPLRAEATAQIAHARRAGVHTVLITGDHPNTAFAIAKEAGLTSEKERLITGQELDGMSDKELRQRVVSIDVYARVSPAHKIRIVDAWQARGEVVAMTGDGVNDAPALTSADIGIALGSGTEVAKGASDMVLLDNNLSVITAAIEHGRAIFDNIRKTTVYLMAASFTEIVLIAGALVLGLPLPLLPVQILWINLVADSLPNVGLTFEQPEPDVMDRPPRPRNEPLLNREMLSYIFFIGIMTDIVLLALYLWILHSTADAIYARTMMFAAVGINSLIYVFAIRQLRSSIFRSNPFSNLWLTCGVGIGMIAMLVALYVPLFQEAFEVHPLGLFDVLVLLGMGSIKFLGIEVAKEFFHARRLRNKSIV